MRIIENALRRSLLGMAIMLVGIGATMIESFVGMFLCFFFGTLSAIVWFALSVVDASDGKGFW